MIGHILDIEEKEEGWSAFIQFTEKAGKDDFIQQVVFFPRLKTEENELRTEGTVKSHGQIKVTGFIRYLPFLPEGFESSITRLAENSYSRKMATGRIFERVNHHIPENSEEVKFFKQKGKYERSKNHPKGRGNFEPFVNYYDKLYTLLNKEWVPQVVIDFKNKQIKKEKHDADFAKFVDLHESLRNAKSSEEILDTLKRYTVVTGEGEDPRLRYLRKRKNLIPPITVIDHPVAKGSSTSRYGLDRGFGKPGRRSWKMILHGMEKRDELSPLQKGLALKMGLL